MRIKFVGHTGIRKIGPYTWRPENNHIQEVEDGEILEDILTYPRPDFVQLDEAEELPGGEPVTTVPGIGPARAGELSTFGVMTVADLAGQDADGIEALAKGTGATRGQIKGWVKAAQEEISND